MRNIPERAGIPEIRKLDVAFCECGGPLDFFLQPGFMSPTGVGAIIESCARCKRSNVMQPVAPRRIADYAVPVRDTKVLVPVPEPGPDCTVCGGPTIYKGQGRKRKWCDDCQPIEQQKIKDALNEKRKEYDRQRARKHRRAA